MNRTGALAVIALVSVACSDSWVEFESPDGPGGSFAISMPARPVTKPSPMGTVYVVTNGDIAYDIGVSAVPSAFRDPAATERIFDEMQKSFIGGATPPTRQTQLRLGPDGYPGREIVFEKKTSTGLAVFTGRAYRVRNILYTLTVRRPAARAGDPSVQRFFDSFRVVRPPAA